MEVGRVLRLSRRSRGEALMAIDPAIRARAELLGTPVLSRK